MKKLIFVFSTALVFIGCDKKDDAPVTPSLEVVTNNLIGTYKITAATATNGGITVEAFATYFPACQRDDIYTLTATTSTTGGYNVTDAGVACSPTTTTTAPIPYSLNTADKTITINWITQPAETGDISITTTGFIVSQANYRGSGATLKVTYTKQ